MTDTQHRDTHETGVVSHVLPGVTVTDQILDAGAVAYLVEIEKPAAEILVHVHYRGNVRRLVCTRGPMALEIIDVELVNAAPTYHTRGGASWWALHAATAVMMRRQGV